MNKLGLRCLRLAGTHFQVGRQLGERLRGFVRPHYGPEDMRFAEACARQVERCYSAGLEKLRGIIAGGGLEAEQFRCHFLTKGVAVAACVGVVVGPERSAEGEALVGRNYHWPLADRVWCELRQVEITGELPHLGYTHHWGGLPDVLNAAGLYVAIFSVPQVPLRRPGLQWHIVIDYLANRCSTVAEAAEFLASAPHLRSFTYLVADAQGGAIAAEATPTGVSIRPAQDGILVVTNHHVAGEAPATERARSRALYAGVLQRLDERRQWDWEGVRALIADHQLGVCVGDHDRDSQAWGTLFAAMIRPEAREFAVCPGFPCREPFQPASVATRLRATKPYGGRNRQECHDNDA